MASSSGEDYGALDDEEMLIVATHAEHRDITPPAPKRRRLNDAAEGNDRVGKRGRSNGPQRVRDTSLSLGRSSPIGKDDDKVHSRPRSVRTTTGRASTARVSPIDDRSADDGDFVDASVGLSCTRLRRSAEADKETDTPKKISKSKYRIHIPKQAVVPKDLFLTQPPAPSSSPYRIRGAIWQKPKNPSTAAEPRPTSIEWQAETNHSLEERRSPSRFPLPVEEDAFDPSPHPIRSGAIAQDEVEGLPSDAFDSENDAIYVSSQERLSQVRQSKHTVLPRTTATQANLRQTTLFGATAQNAPASQVPKRHNWPLANKEEPPTHHKLDREVMNTWVYPTNLGTIRDYQFNIVQRGLYHNLLVALPTGLGKTFIAATVMLNWFRWTTESQIMFVAPTKPLVSQQVEACFNIAGIPRSATTMLTGETAARLRSEEYLTKRVFFMTPQTLMNDLGNGNCDPKKIVLLVVDEAHRATGNYSYVEIVKLLRRFNKSFRVLALTATPGASVEAVQAVIDGLDISRVEIRTESSLDIRQYVHSRKIDTQVFDYSEEMEMLMGLWQKSLQPVLNKLNGMNAYWQKDPVALTPYGLTKARQAWMSTAGKNANMGVKGMVNAIFTVLSSRAHATELLKFHGIGPFYQNLLAFRDTTEAGGKGAKYRREITGSEHFQKLLSRMEAWISNSEFVGHPKLEYLRTVILNHFLDANEGANAANGEQSSTRIMVFVHYRDSAEEVAKVLKRHAPMIRPHVFVGQTNAKGSEGMDQKKQLDIIEKFKKGIYNTIVATSIGEEGLDIGEVDLIVCYDSSASPIRMLQRMGRTGRKRAGNIVVLLMRGKEENSFTQAKDNYEKMQHMIAEGSRFTFHEDRSMRIVPKDIQPIVDKKLIEIPPENTQPGLPEPGPKKQAKRSKKPAKKFHMPDGVRTGFVKASRLKERNLGSQAESGEDGALGSSTARLLEPSPEPEPIPSLEDVLLSATEERQLVRSYLDIGGDTPQMVETPRMDVFPALQRSLRPTKHLNHGRTTRRVVSMLMAMHAVDIEQVNRFERNLDPDDCTNLGSSAKSADLPERVESVERPARQTSLPAARRSMPPWSRSTNPTSSDVEGDTNDDPSGFVVHSSPEGDAQGAMSSVTSSPPPLDAPEKPFYTPLGKEYGADTDSDEELPEFSNLVGKTTIAPSPCCVSNQRRGKRKVFEDDSDDE